MQRTMSKALQGALMICSALVFNGAVAADLKFAVEPTYTQERAAEVYGPLLSYLNKSTGHNFELVTARNYHFYWSDLRSRSDIDFAMEEAHFVDYRAQNFGYQPLVRTAESSSYSLLTMDPLEGDPLRGLVARRVVCMPAPNLGFAMLLEMYPNPMQQPDVRSAAASWRDAVEIVFAGEADAAMVPTWLQNLYPNLYPVHQTREFPGSAISASPRVDPAIVQQVADALLRLHEDDEMYEVLVELGVSEFIATDANEYAGSEAMLKPFYGYGDDTAPTATSP